MNSWREPEGRAGQQGGEPVPLGRGPAPAPSSCCQASARWALMANEVYMIVRLGRLYDVNVSKSAAMGFLSSLRAAFAGQTLATLLPFPPMQLAVGVSVTYAVGKAAQAWIKAGCPSEMAEFKGLFKNVKATAADKWREYLSHPQKRTFPGRRTGTTGLRCRARPAAAEKSAGPAGGNNPPVVRFAAGQRDRRAGTLTMLKKSLRS